MVVGMRYCGGCNCGYDRAEAARLLRAALASDELVLSRHGDGQNLDVLLLLCGCGVRCVSCGDTACEKVYITSLSDVDEALDVLTKFSKGGK